MTFGYPATDSFVEYATKLIAMKVQPGTRYIDSDGELQEAWGSESTLFYVMKGGVSQRQLALWYATGDDFYGKYLDHGLFLTQRPASDYVHPAQAVKLWFVPIANDGSARFYIKGYYDDGTTVTDYVSAPLTANKLYEFNCNPAHNHFTLEPAGKRMLSFDCWLQSGATVISDVRNFTFDWKYCERPFYLMFANSLGGVDDVYLGGYGAENYDTEATSVVRPPAIDDTVYNATILTPNKKGQNAFKINTGWKTATQMRHIRDLLVSRQVWLLYPNAAVSSYNVIPVVITSTSKELIDYQNDLHSCDIEMSEAHKDQYVFDNRLY